MATEDHIRDLCSDILRELKDARKDNADLRAALKKHEEAADDNTKALDDLASVMAGLAEVVGAMADKIDIAKGVGGLAAKLFGGSRRRDR